MNTTKLKTRRATLADLDRLLEISRECLLQINIRDYGEEAILRHMGLMDDNSYINSIRNDHYFVVVYGDEVIASGGLRKLSESLCNITKFFVYPDFIRKGVGSFLMRRLEKDSWYLQSSTIRVNSSVAGIEFYKAFGYTHLNSHTPVEQDGFFPMIKHRDV